jgi:hypothetical protein
LRFRAVVMDVKVTETKPGNFTPRVVDKTDDYVRVEYESPIFGVASRFLLVR